MKRSTERFLTTHTGSLPRPDDLIRMMYAKEEGVPVDRAALDARVRLAVAEVVKKQADAGIGLLTNDLRDCLAYPGGQGLPVNRHPFFLGVHHPDQVVRTGQAAGVGGEEAVHAALHTLSRAEP